ncbi:hypothetical protein DFP72DRAFT_1042892 [Ephemerocybe angulata]|uniref:Uncharacterized protein n=1 Tax=Ephemerocybe angulata TaxID=980116 RepID=A0A8H6I700_9AGAR|nr:hypothetical protein DFP72DRAFT_1042892 [Tulosesus angulatus]
MNTLRRVLQPLKSPSSNGGWAVIITPDPTNFSRGIQSLQYNGLGPDKAVFHMKIDGKFNLDSYIEENPSFGFALNTTTAKKTVHSGPQDSRTEWVSIIAPKTSTSSDGLRVSDILLELLKEFPKYDLTSTDSAENAIDKIENRLREVATVQDFGEVESPSAEKK